MPNQLQDLAHGADAKNVITPNQFTTAGQSPAIDMMATDGPCCAIQCTGIVSGCALAGRFQESDDHSTWTDVPGGSFRTVDQTDTIQLLTFARSRRYLRYIYSFGDAESPVCSLAIGLMTQRKIVV